jgi:uncharacterized protein (DUF433 family)
VGVRATIVGLVASRDITILEEVVADVPELEPDDVRVALLYARRGSA